MMTNDRLMFAVAIQLESANDTLQAAWDRKALSEVEARKLAEALRGATAAATELQRRAAGCPPAKDG